MKISHSNLKVESKVHTWVKCDVLMTCWAYYSFFFLNHIFVSSVKIDQNLTQVVKGDTQREWGVVIFTL